METINKTASGLVSDIDYHYREVVQEYDVVIEAWAADYADYVIDSAGDSLVLSSREELIAEAVDDIKAGEIRVPQSTLLDRSLGSDNPADELLRRLDEIAKNYPQAEHDAMYLLDGETYLHLQTAADGYDYTLYDKSLRHIDDGSIADSPDISFDDAYIAVMELEHMYPESCEKVPLDILDKIAAVREQDIEDYKRAHNIGQPLSEVEQWEADHIVDFTVSEQTVIPAQMPPPYDVMDFTDAQWKEIELGWGQNLDVSQYAEPDIPAESMAKIRDALSRGLIIQTVAEVPPSPEQAYHYPMPDPNYSAEDLEDCGYMDGDLLPLSQDRALELYGKDVTIYAVHDGGETSMVFGEKDIEEHGGLFAVPYEEWEIARQEPSEEAPTKQDSHAIHSVDFRGSSMTVSDVVAPGQDKPLSYHYGEKAGSYPLPGAGAVNNPLRSLEDSIEQNDNQLDGIINNVAPMVDELEKQAKSGQPISLMDLARATHAEDKGKRPSVLEKLKQPPSCVPKKSAPKKSAEMEL